MADQQRKTVFSAELDQQSLEASLSKAQTLFDRLGVQLNKSLTLKPDEMLRYMKDKLSGIGGDKAGASRGAASYDSDVRALRENPFDTSLGRKVAGIDPNSSQLVMGQLVNELKRLENAVKEDRVSRQEIARRGWFGTTSAAHEKTIEDLKSKQDQAKDRDEFLSYGKQISDEKKKFKEETGGESDKRDPVKAGVSLLIGQYIQQAILRATANMGQGVSGFANSTAHVGNAGVAGFQAFGMKGGIIGVIGSMISEVVAAGAEEATKKQDAYTNIGRNLYADKENLRGQVFGKDLTQGNLERMGVDYREALTGISALSRARTGTQSFDQLKNEFVGQTRLKQGLGLSEGDLRVINETSSRERSGKSSEELIADLMNRLHSTGSINAKWGEDYNISQLSRHIERISSIVERQVSVTGQADFGAASEAYTSFMFGGKGNIFRNGTEASQLLSGTQNLLANPTNDYSKFMNFQAAQRANPTGDLVQLKMDMEEGGKDISQQRVLMTLQRAKLYGRDARDVAGETFKQQYGLSYTKGVKLYDEFAKGGKFQEGGEMEKVINELQLQKNAEEFTSTQSKTDASMVNSLKTAIEESIGEGILNGFANVANIADSITGGSTMRDVVNAVRESKGMQAIMPPQPKVQQTPIEAKKEQSAASGQIQLDVHGSRTPFQ